MRFDHRGRETHNFITSPYVPYVLTGFHLHAVHGICLLLSRPRLGAARSVSLLGIRIRPQILDEVGLFVDKVAFQARVVQIRWELGHRRGVEELPCRLITRVVPDFLDGLL